MKGIERTKEKHEQKNLASLFDFASLQKGHEPLWYAVSLTSGGTVSGTCIWYFTSV
jgi:hypothetical protein